MLHRRTILDLIPYSLTQELRAISQVARELRGDLSTLLSDVSDLFSDLLRAFKRLCLKVKNEKN